MTMRKGRQFIWGKEQQLAFEEIKCRLVNPQYYICLIAQVDFIYIQIQVNLLWEVHNIKYKTENQN